MVYVIKDTVDIYCFCNLYETAQEHLLSKLHPVSLNKSRSSCILLSIGNFSNPKPRPPPHRAKKVGLKPDPWAVRIPGGRPGGGQAWD